MIVDTDVLLRSLEGARNAQGKAVRARIEGARETGKGLTVLAVTVLEAAYVLESSSAGFGWDRADVARADSLDRPARRLLDAIAQQRHARVLSFDRDLHKLGHAERP